MGLEFRKSKKIGKNTRLNFSQSSVGISTGVKGFSTSINSNGRTSINLSIPGTGLRYRKVFGKKDTSTGIVVFLVAGLMNIMFYLIQITFVLTWWIIKFFIWLMYYLFLGIAKLCKFLFIKIKTLFVNKNE